jgi:hypothetical protein
VRAVLAQDGYLSSSDRLHFGLGSETAANLTIHWPNGLIEKVDNVPADHLVSIKDANVRFVRSEAAYSSRWLRAIPLTSES